MEAIREISKSQAPETQFDKKIAAELWLNIAQKDYRLVGRTIRMGRAPDNDIVLDHKSVSRYHAVIHIQLDQVSLEDLKSRNGVCVNGERIKGVALKENDAIKVGDLEGVYFQRSRKGKEGLAVKSLFQSIEVGRPSSNSLEKFQEIFSRLSPLLSKKTLKLGGLLLFLLLGALFFLKGTPPASSSDKAAAAADANPIVARPIDHEAFDRCVELEDLGNFRNAAACLKNLPHTIEVENVIQRVQKRQADLSEQYYQEGAQAFENYYYDVAVLKWQEVIQIADDRSEYRTKAFAGLQKADERKRLK